MSPHDTLQAVARCMVDEQAAHVLVREHGEGQARGVISSFDIAAVLAGHEPRKARIVRPAPARPAISVGRLAGHTVADVCTAASSPVRRRRRWPTWQPRSSSAVPTP